MNKNILLIFLFSTLQASDRRQVLVAYTGDPKVRNWLLEQHQSRQSGVGDSGEIQSPDQNVCQRFKNCVAQCCGDWWRQCFGEGCIDDCRDNPCGCWCDDCCSR